ncbi:uncharacterized protein Pyn_34321 [Prunus yedoensis var. nudiflora]|uniref:Wound-responsive family protein n=1 Tax=Prunus yedoensis var. nudiflora TaxID=2094558 RepID=A0A314YPP4_PRUYE|nr:uncharacterized protein Pyn_34321 [Prunus yedoensis var. nudiflora]
MCATRGAWIAAVSVGAVEALKDQGFCRWSYTMRSLNQHAKNNMRSFLQAKELLFFFFCYGFEQNEF